MTEDLLNDILASSSAVAVDHPFDAQEDKLSNSSGNSPTIAALDEHPLNLLGSIESDGVEVDAGGLAKGRWSTRLK